MPIKSGIDSEGCFYQWGNQEKYHYSCGNELERQKAYEKAREQEIAIISSGFNEGLISLKKWRNNAESSNIDRLLYNDETRELIVKFNGGTIYTYYDIDFDEFLGVMNGAGICKTSGQNKYGSWFIGKTPSVGAACFRILIRSGKKYSRGGSLR